MIAKKNNNTQTSPSQGSPVAHNKLWDHIRIGYLCFIFSSMASSVYISWTQVLSTKVVAWYYFLIQVFLTSVAILFASQLQIEKRTPNTSMWQHLGLRWQGINLKKVGLCTLVYLVLHYINCVERIKADQLNKKSAEAALAAIPTWNPFIAAVKEILSSAATPAEAPGVVLGKPWWGGIWIIGLVICVLGPITEEMLFRSILINELRYRGVEKILAWIVAAVLFSIAHGKLSLAGNIILFLGGMLFTWLREKTGSLFVPIWAHMIHNTGAFMSILYTLSHGVTLPDVQFVKTIKYYYGVS